VSVNNTTILFRIQWKYYIFRATCFDLYWVIFRSSEKQIQERSIFQCIAGSQMLRDYIKKVKLKWSRYRPGVAQRVGRGIAILFHDRGTRRGCVVSSTPPPHFTPGKDPVPIEQEAGWAPGPVWTGGKSRSHRHSIPDRPACSQSLYRLSYHRLCYRNLKYMSLYILGSM